MATLRVAALPRDPNPYQSLLYAAMRRHDVDVTYLGELTGSHTLNVLLLPAEVLARKVDVVHLHWVFGFQLPGRRRIRALGLLSQAWFRMFLASVRWSGASLVWTAHNVLPHEPVFWDDLAARRSLVDAADLVIAHNVATVEAMQELGLHPRATRVVPHGPFRAGATARRDVAAGPDAPVVLGFVGMVARHKGVDDLVRTFADLRHPSARLLVAGACEDADLARQLERDARGARVELRLRRLTDEEMRAALGHVDVLVLPYREVTTSGVAFLGLGAGLPLVVPDLPGFADLPDAAVVRYDPHLGLHAALVQVLGMPRTLLQDMGAAGRADSAANSWEQVAASTVVLMRGIRTPVRAAR